MGSLSIGGLTKVFDEIRDPTVAVDDFNLEIEEGEFVVLVGPSGSGKSTVLRMIAGLETPTEGKVVLGSEDITSQKPSDRDIAMVFQNYALYPHLDAKGNMSFGLKMQGEYSKAEIEQRVTEAATIMEIEPLLENMPSELSGGQKQRVALGRAIVRDPEVFLMDEPLSNLDAKLRRLMRTEIQQLQAELGVTTIYVTHDQTEAMTMGDRIVILQEGKIQQIGTPVEAYYEPANSFVAQFIGSPEMNLIPGTVSRSNAHVTLETSEFSYELSGALSDDISEGIDEVLIGVRPEALTVVPEDHPNSFTPTIDVIEPLGKERLLYFDLAEATYIASISGQNQSISEGDQVHLTWDESNMHLFDKQSTRAIKNCPLEGGSIPESVAT